MNGTTDLNETAVAAPAGMSVLYYAERLRDYELELVLGWAEFCLTGKQRANKLAYYVAAIVRFEVERRTLLEEYPGGEIIECVLPAMPSDKWSDLEVALAVNKLRAITRESDGEVGLLFNKLFDIALVEAEWRLGLK